MGTAVGLGVSVRQFMSLQIAYLNTRVITVGTPIGLLLSVCSDVFLHITTLCT